MSSSKRIMDGVFWSTMANLLNALFGFFSFPILLAHFGEHENALIGVAFSVNLYLRLMDLGFANGNIKFFSQWIARGRTVRVGKLFQSNIIFYAIVGLLNALVLFVVSCFSDSIYDLTPHQVIILNKMLYVLMISAFLGWISALFDQFLKANEIIGWEQRLMVFIKLLQIVVLVLTIKFNWSIVQYFTISCLLSLLILPFTVYKIRTLPYKVSFMPKYHPAVFKQIIPYGLSVFSISIFQVSANSLRPVLLTARAAVVTMNDYTAINSFINIISVLSISFLGSMLPAATKAVLMGNIDQKHRIAYDGTKYISIFLAIIVFGFMLVAKELITIYVGPRYYLMPWLYISAMTLLLTHTSGLSSLVFAENKMRPVVYMSAFSAITSLSIAWILTPHYKIGGVVIGWLYYCTIQTAFFYVYYYPVVLKLNSWRILFQSFLFPVLPVGTCALVAYFLFVNIDIHNVNLSLLGKIVPVKAMYLKAFYTGLVFVAISIPTTYFLIFNNNDRAFVKRFLPGKKSVQV